jgi:photosystem II stability/assembly factor-like uncharacterized protein
MPVSTAFGANEEVWLSLRSGRLMKSRDGGRTFCTTVERETIPFSEPGSRYFTTIVFQGPRIGYALGWDRILYRSEDEGLHWKRLSDQAHFFQLSITSTNEIVLVGDDGLYRIAD